MNLKVKAAAIMVGIFAARHADVVLVSKGDSVITF
jgi:hypothetical protein